MTQATRLTTQEAIELVSHNRITANHVLVTHGIVTGDVRRKPGVRHDGLYAWVYGAGAHDYLSASQLEPMLKLGVAHVELEEPSPFDDEAFEGWEIWANGKARFRPNCASAVQIYDDGHIYLHGFRYAVVPTYRIPEAARHINALLALGEGK